MRRVETSAILIQCFNYFVEDFVRAYNVFDHSHPISPLTRHTLFPPPLRFTSSFFFFFLEFTESILRYPYTLECRAISWSTADPQGVAPLKKASSHPQAAVRCDSVQSGLRLLLAPFLWKRMRLRRVTWTAHVLTGCTIWGLILLTQWFYQSCP